MMTQAECSGRPRPDRSRCLPLGRMGAPGGCVTVPVSVWGRASQPRRHGQSGHPSPRRFHSQPVGDEVKTVGLPLPDSPAPQLVRPKALSGFAFLFPVLPFLLFFSAPVLSASPTVSPPAQALCLSHKPPNSTPNHQKSRKWGFKTLRGNVLRSSLNSCLSWTLFRASAGLDPRYCDNWLWGEALSSFTS